MILNIIMRYRNLYCVNILNYCIKFQANVILKYIILKH